MSKRSKQLSLMIAKGFAIMLNSLPVEVVVDQPGAEAALQRYCLRPDNHLTSAFSELLQELNPCIDADKLQESDVENTLMRVKAEFKG